MKIVNSDDTGIAALSHELGHGKLVVVPTPRWYMVCAAADNADACAAIFLAKDRPTSKSLALLVPDITYLSKNFEISESLLSACECLASGHFAMRLRWRTHPLERTPNVGDPIALVSVPDGVLGRLVKSYGAPLAATSVNVSGDGSSTDPGPAVSANEVIDLVSRTGMPVSLLCDGGISPLFNHMTIVDDTGSRIVVERSGLVHPKALRAAGLEIEE